MNTFLKDNNSNSSADPSQTVVYGDHDMSIVKHCLLNLNQIVQKQEQKNFEESLQNRKMKNVSWSINSRSTIGQAYYNLNKSTYGTQGFQKDEFVASMKKGKSQTTRVTRDQQRRRMQNFSNTFQVGTGAL